MSGLAAVFAAMEEIRALVDATPDITDADRAEGHVHVAGLYKWAMDRVFLGGDPLRPRFVRLTDTLSQWGVVNPDNLYLIADIAEGEEYVITGSRGTCETFVVEVRDGIGRREDHVHSKGLCSLEAHELDFEADGTFRLHLGGAQRPRNWLPLPPTTANAFIRATFADWTAETLPPFTIERLGAPVPSAPRASLAETDVRFERAAAIIRDLGRFNLWVAKNWRDKTPVNAFPPPETDITLAPFPGQRSAIARFAFEAEDDALVIALARVEWRYLSVAIFHQDWYTALDFHNRQTSLNTAQARASSDDVYRYVISARDPGVANWLDTGGRLRGFIFFRCQGLVPDNLPQPMATLTKAGCVRELFPADEPVVSAEERAQVLTRRRVGAQRRIGY